MKNHSDPDHQTLARGEQNKTALWQSVVISVVSVAIFFTLLEGGLAFLGVKPALQSRDPFVGFVSNIPLFIEKTDTDSQKIMATAVNKLSFFNPQQFPKEKAPGTYRIFCLGGSTTFGRPYDDTTSFPGWLRELLPVADSRRNWEVINAGGISYASYRVATLMEELALYEPDLFIIYSGHNEFLEERTYRKMREIPSFIKSTASLLTQTRTWTAMRSVLASLGIMPRMQQDKRVQLSAEVNTALSRSAGPDLYERDNTLKDRILMHYRISLERMVDIARSAGAEVIFVTPASNLKDSSPFKSQHTAGLDETAKKRSKELISQALDLINDSEWTGALKALDQALSIDPLYAELHYRRGKVLFALGRHEEAGVSFTRALDEDVCPLRALSPMQNILAKVASAKDVPLVDFIDILKQRLLTDHDHQIAGQEYFLDHVHPTIEGNRILAAALVREMIGDGIVQPSENWGEDAVSAVGSRVEEGLDLKYHMKSLVNLARVLNWAGKSEDAGRLAKQALESGIEDPELIAVAARIMATLSEQQKDIIQARKYYRIALAATPDSPELHFQLGLMAMNSHTRDFDVAASHLLFASTFWPEHDMVHMTFGLTMAERRRYSTAYASISEALRLNPQNREAGAALARLRTLPGGSKEYTAPPKVSLKTYESGSPHMIMQMRKDSNGRYIPHGILTEWYEGGELKRLLDYADGVPHGAEITWDRSGNVISRAEFRQGVRMIG